MVYFLPLQHPGHHVTLPQSEHLPHYLEHLGLGPQVGDVQSEAGQEQVHELLFDIGQMILKIF